MKRRDLTNAFRESLSEILNHTALPRHGVARAQGTRRFLVPFQRHPPLRPKQTWPTHGTWRHIERKLISVSALRIAQRLELRLSQCMRRYAAKKVKS